MSRFAVKFAILLAAGLSACTAQDADTPANETETAQGLETVASEGQAVFQRECELCHAQGGTGTMMLALRLGEANALLEERDDLSADYVATIVRQGINSMPTITRVDVTDEELSEITLYLTGERLGSDASDSTGDEM